MHIHGPQNQPHLQANDLKRLADSGSGKHLSARQTTRNGAAGAASEAEHVLSPELRKLAAEVRKSPEIREERLKDVTTRLARGEYLTKEMAQRTAAAIIGRS